MKDRHGRFAALVFDADKGQEISSVVLPERGHDIAVRPGDSAKARRECVAFARQPGNFAVVFAAGDPGLAPRWFTSRDDRHFHGHGAFSRDGRLLYTTENDFEAGRGVIGVRDAAAGYQQTGEFSSGGTDPHDLELLADGRTLVVANGGIKTHPSMPRRELNIATMQPNLAYIDTATGDLLEAQELPKALHQLSIRHLSAGVHDTVVFGCQFRGPKWQTQAIAGRHRRGQSIELLDMPEDITLAMRNYVASVAMDRRGETCVITAPFGGLAVVIDVTTGRYLKHYVMDNVFGAAAGTPGEGFVLTSGSGPLAYAPPATSAAARTPEPRPHVLATAWDNHLTAIT